MQSTETPNGASATSNGRPVLRADLCARLMMARGAKSFAEQARRFGLTPAYYNEIRKGLKTPSLDRALVMASEAGTTVDTLFERAA